jgi:hypothetical protein
MMSINIVLFLAGIAGMTGGVGMIAGATTTSLPLIDSNSSNSLVSLSYNNTTGNVSMDSASVLLNKFGFMQNGSSGFIAQTPLFGLYNTFSLVYVMVMLVINIFFAPIATLLAIPNCPVAIIYMVGVMWVVMYALALLMFIKGWDF